MRISFSNKILSVSDVYETFGQFEKRTPYLNCCLEIETDLTTPQLLSFLQEIEKQMGKSEFVSRDKFASGL